jgi:hypothetical protein
MKGIGRNNPCPCGSGKKFKKCCMGKYPRETVSYVGFKEAFDGLTFEQAYVHTLSGEKVKADYVFSQVQYTGKTGKNKVISLIHNKVTFDINKSLATDFDLIFAIDTNTEKINNDLISISSLFQCNGKIIGQKLRFSYSKVANICFKNYTNNSSEKIAIAKLIKMIISSTKYNMNLRIAIITDHDVNKHAQYNNKNIPIYGELYLAPNMTIIYAASGKGISNIMNILLNDCHKDAKNYLRKLSQTMLLGDDDLNITIDQIPNSKDGKHIIIFYPLDSWARPTL